MQNVEQKIIEIHFDYIIINETHMIRTSNNDFANLSFESKTHCDIQYILNQYNYRKFDKTKTQEQVEF